MASMDAADRKIRRLERLLAEQAPMTEKMVHQVDEACLRRACYRVVLAALCS